MRTISNDAKQVTTENKQEKTMPKLATFTTTLSDGREITIREMTGRDLIFLEKDTKSGDVEKGMKVIERLIVGDEKISYEEILDLGVKDFRKLSELVGKANGTDDEGDDPN